MMIPGDLKLLVNTAARTAGLASVMFVVCKFVTWRNATHGQLDNLLLKLIYGDHLIYLEYYCCLVCEAALTWKTVICMFPPIRTSYLNVHSFLFTVPRVDSTDAVVMKHFYIFFR
jgi:hypothetical protein